MKIYPILSIVLIAGLILTSCDQSKKRTGRSRAKKEKKMVTIPGFDPDSAYHYVAQQVAFGPRVAGTEAHSKCANWLTNKAEEFADTVIVQKFKARTYDGVTRNGVNIIASFQPEKEDRVLLMAHWDSRPFADHDEDETKHKEPIDGANDGASGVGILLEMARQFRIQPTDVGIDIVFFDLEDWGPPTQSGLYDEKYWGLGSQYWSETPHVYRYEALYGILLDMVGAENPSFPVEYFSKQYAGFVINLVWNTASDLGYGSYFPREDGIAATDDHFYVNKIAKIPSIDILHQENSPEGSNFFQHWHTSEDSMDKIDKETLRMVGEVVMTVVYNE